MKNILLLLLLFTSTLVFSQTTSRRFPTGKVIHTQTGAGAGYYDVSCNYTDEGGLYDGTSVQVGDYLFVSDGGYGYFLPIININSSGFSSINVRVDHTGLPLGSIPVGVGYITKGSDHFKFFPFVSGISNANQQISIEETMSSIDSVLQYKLPERTSGSSAPAYTPTANDSWLAQNGTGSLYFYNGSSWTLVGTGGSSISEQVCLDTIVITGITPTCVVGTPMIRKVLNTWDNISGHVVTDIPAGVLIKIINSDTAIVAYCGAYPTLLTAGSYYADSISTSGYTTTPTGSVIRPVFIVDANNYLKVNTGFGFQSSSSLTTVTVDYPLTGTGTVPDPVKLITSGVSTGALIQFDGSGWDALNLGIDATLAGSGIGGSPLKIAQQGATSGQALAWDGFTWTPTTVVGTTNLTLTGTGPYTLNSNTGTDVTFTQGTGMSLVRTSNDLTVNLANTAVTPGNYGVAGYPSFMVDAQGRITSAIDNALPDGSNTNEGIIGVSAGSSANSIITSNTTGANGVTISIGSTGNGLSIGETLSSNGGTISLQLSNDVQAIEALTGTGILVRTATDTWATRLLTAGAGISISANPGGVGGNPQITNTGDTNGADDITTSTAAGGDLTGTYPNPTININKVDSTKVINFGLSVLDLGVNGATSGQVLKFNGTQWAPGTDNSGSGATDLTFTGASSPYTLNSSTGTDVTITNGTGMNLSRSVNNLTVALGNTGVTPGNYGVSGYPSLTIDAQGRITFAIDNTLPDGSNTNEGILGVSAGNSTNSIISSNTVGATGVTISIGSTGNGLGITETTSSNGGTITLALTDDVAAIEGLGTNGFYVRTGVNTWASRTIIPGAGISVSNGAGASGNPTITNTGDLDGTNDLLIGASAGGDLTGTYPNPTININKIDSTKIINGSISVLDLGVNGATSGQVLKFNGTQWYAGTDLSGSGATDLTFTGSSSPVTLNSSSGTDVIFTAGTGISFSQTSNNITITNSGDTNGSDDIIVGSTAGGDLSGTYPNPTVAMIRNVNVVATTPTTGQVLKFNGTSWAPAADLGGTLHYQSVMSEGVLVTQENSLNFVSSADVDINVTDDSGIFATQVDVDIPTGAIDYSEIQVVTGARLLGNPSGSTSAASEIPLSPGLVFSSGALALDVQRAFIEGSTSSSIDLDANVGNVKDKNGSNVAFTIPTNTSLFKVYKNGMRLSETGSLTTRDYSVNTTTHVLTFVTTLVSTDRIIIEK